MLLFARLGHYALWDDEAVTALAAQGVWRTGDTTAVIGHNVVGYANGRLLRGLADRSTPPLPAYVAAPFVGLASQSALAARFPFASMGVLCIALLCLWLARDGADWKSWLLFGACTLGNVSLFLYFRNCRYYAPAILLSMVLVYQVLHYDGRRWKLVLASLSASALFATHYLAYAVLLLCLGMDHVVWGRKHVRLRPLEWSLFGVPQLIIAGAVFGTWNTLDTKNGELMFANSWPDRLRLLGWTLRDMNACEYGAVGFLALAPIVALAVRDRWLARAVCGLCVYVLAMGLMAPTPVAARVTADMRYLAPVIPLCIATTALTLRALWRTRWAWFVLPVAALLSFSNLLHGGPLLRSGLRSTLFEFTRELWSAPRDPYTVTAEWIQAEVPEGGSVLVIPSYMNYPLMFHAPHAVYAWQFDPPPRGELASLPAIHFKGQVAPDYIIAFGPQALADVETKLIKTADPEHAYDKCAVLDVFWKDRYRPELMWRDFREVTGFDRATQGVCVYRRRVP